MTLLRTLVVCVSLALTARETTASDVETDFASGQRLFANGDWAAAAKALQLVAPRLADAKKRSLAYRQLGLAQFELAQMPAAEESFSLSLAADPLAELNPAQDAPAAISMFRAVRARLDGTLAITTDQPARVTIDGIERGTAPLTLKLAIGSHHVRAASPDSRHVAENAGVVIYSGRRSELRLALKPVIAYIDVSGPPGFSIAVDGVPVAQTPAQNIAVTPGKRVITVSSPGHEPKVVALNVAAGNRHAIDGALKKLVNLPGDLPPPPAPRHTRPWAWLAAGVGAVAAAVGIALFAPTDPLADHDSSRRNTGIGFMVGGSVSGVASAVLFILHRDR